MTVVISFRYEDLSCFVIERASARIIALGPSAASTSAASSIVLSSGCRNFLVTSVFLVS